MKKKVVKRTIPVKIEETKAVDYASRSSIPMYKKNYNAVNVKLNVFQDKHSEWRWDLVSSNGNIVADSAEGYRTKWGCKRAARKFLGL